MNLKLGNEKEKTNDLDNMSPLEKANALMNDNDDFGEFGNSNIDRVGNINNSDNDDNYNNNNQYSDLKEPNIIGLDSDNDNNNNSTNTNQNNNSNNFSIFGDSDDDDDILNSLSGGLNLQDAIKEKAEKEKA